MSTSIDLAIRAPRADCEDKSDPHLHLLHCINLIAIKVSWIIVPSFRTSLAVWEKGGGNVTGRYWFDYASIKRDGIPGSLLLYVSHKRCCVHLGANDYRYNSCRHMKTWYLKFGIS